MTGNDLKKMREKLKLTQSELAKQIGYADRVHIARLEARGRKKLPAGAIARIRAAGLEKKGRKP